MLTFYLIAGALAVLAALALVRPLLSGGGAADDRDARDAQVFRDQLAELDRDLARGTITAEEAEGARIEISRRLIAAAERARRPREARRAPQGQSGLVAGLALIGTPALAAALYVGLGAPGVPDQPLSARVEGLSLMADAAAAGRPGQAEAEAELAGRTPPPDTPDPQYVALVDKLEKVVADRPDDVQGHRLLAEALMNLGRWHEAWQTYDRLIGLLGDGAGAELHAAKAEAMIMAAGGYVSPGAEAEIATALKTDPGLPIARYYGGLALHQAGRTDEAVAMWQALRRDSPPDAPYLPWLDRMLAGATGAPAAGTPGPDRSDVAAAEKLSPEERAQMIEGMVTRLEARLTGDGGSAEEWLRLIRSYVRLGRPDEAARAYRLAETALAGDPQAGFVREQALLMGVPVK